MCPPQQSIIRGAMKKIIFILFIIAAVIAAISGRIAYKKSVDGE
jgi:type IV secretory pathway VirB2 component (pilin)